LARRAGAGPQRAYHHASAAHLLYVLTDLFWIRDNDEGIYRLPFPDGRHAPIDAADQADVIAAILQNPDPHDRQIYPLFGPEELDWHGIAAKVEATLGIPVRYEPIDIPNFAAGLTAAGASAPSSVSAKRLRAA
jgi:NAD(P)H dehydrogenase (quinone)